MDKNEFIIKRDKAGTYLWTTCNKTMRRLDQNLVTQGIDDIIKNIKQYISLEKDKALGYLCKYEALSGSIGLSGDDMRKIESLKESIENISSECIVRVIHVETSFLLNICFLQLSYH